MAVKKEELAHLSPVAVARSGFAARSAEPTMPRSDRMPGTARWTRRVAGIGQRLSLLRFGWSERSVDLGPHAREHEERQPDGHEPHRAPGPAADGRPRESGDDEAGHGDDVED